MTRFVERACWAPTSDGGSPRSSVPGRRRGGKPLKVAK